MQKLAAYILAGTMVAGLAVAQTPYEPPPSDEPQSNLESDIESGIQGFMEKLLNEVQPHLDQLGRDLNDTVNSFSPVLDQLGGLMDDVGNYQAPERLANGDVLIRRRPDAPPPPPIGNTLRDLMAPHHGAPPTEAAPSIPEQPQPQQDEPKEPDIEL
ncbi:hypothetical protein [Paracoccus aestuariivivens]|uniref:AAA+ family ATPase n=1 Tax=Paracoccus aestuariivivens TaxID=1820333 RepID=A0A6L6J9N1_9RHOB|nr:hypothetical protein [Paracoccus aestuariivivens]MTH78873.1 hypothetical protein [Paracoccus aestuariivivens]